MSATSSKRTPRIQPRTRRTLIETRRAILDAAERRLIGGGPDAIRLQKIAADAGVSHPAILQHFGSREGLVEAMVLNGFARLQSQLLEGWPSQKNPDVEGTFARFYDVTARGGVARMLASLILMGRGASAMKSNVFRPAAERLHAGRVRRAQRSNRPLPPLEQSLNAAAFLIILVLGDSLFGPSVRRAIGLQSPGNAQRFRRWLIKVVERMDPQNR